MIRTIALAVAMLVSIPAMAQTNTKVVVIPLGDAEFNYANFSGPQRDLQQSLLEAEGWSVCYEGGFDSNSLLGSIFGSCRGAELMLACRPSHNDNGGFFTLAAYAPRVDVTFPTGTSSSTSHNANGTEWYYDGSFSWGFAPGGAAVNKNHCDWIDVQGQFDANTPYRMCMHTQNGSLDPGYRCGQPFTDGPEWERVILQRDP